MGRRTLPPIGLQLLALLVFAVIVIIGVTIAVRSGQSGARKVMISIATVLLAIAIPVAGDTLGFALFGGPPRFEAAYGLGYIFFGRVAGSSSRGSTGTQPAPSGSTASEYTWAQLGHDYPGLRTPCQEQPNGAGQLQCYWSHYSNAASAEPSAEKLPEGALRGVLLTDLGFYQQKYPLLEGCTAATLTTDAECISGAQTLDGYDTEIASIVQQGLSGQ